MGLLNDLFLLPAMILVFKLTFGAKVADESALAGSQQAIE